VGFRIFWGYAAHPHTPILTVTTAKDSKKKNFCSTLAVLEGNKDLIQVVLKIPEEILPRVSMRY